jgi:hypothetical protein
MQYSCNDIQRLLASPMDAFYDHDAFISHVESCEECSQMGILEPSMEMALASLLPYFASESMAPKVMNVIQRETQFTNPIRIANKIRIVLLGAIYLIIASIALANQKVILNGVISSMDELNHIAGISSHLGITVANLLTYVNKASLSPLLLTSLMGVTIIVWIFSVLRFRDTN